MVFFYWKACEEPRFRTPALLTTACLGMLALFSFVVVGYATLVWGNPSKPIW
jgi:hypothetical protein